MLLNQSTTFDNISHASFKAQVTVRDPKTGTAPCAIHSATGSIPCLDTGCTARSEP